MRPRSFLAGEDGDDGLRVGISRARFAAGIVEHDGAVYLMPLGHADVFHSRIFWVGLFYALELTGVRSC
jgi:hypothetical protein